MDDSLSEKSVPTSVELENNSNQNKYTVNRSPKSGVTLSKLTLFLMALAAAALIALAVGLTILLYPKCHAAPPEALVQKPKTDHIRLPTTLEPLHYRLRLMPFLEQNFTTSGNVTITIDAKEDTDEISLNAFDMEIDERMITVKEVNTSAVIGVKSHSYNNDSQIYTIQLNGTLKKDQHYDLEIIYTGHLRDNMQGFYRSSYRFIDSRTNTTKWMASTQFSPTDARRAFPCFDEPAFKARFTISIARPSSMTSISNMPKRTTATVGQPNWEWDHYGETPRMSTYLVAFVVSDLTAYRYNSSGKPLTVWTRKSVDETRLIIDLSPKILNFFEKYFNINFPLPKIDLVAVPDFGFTAMENWGLITFRESMLFDEKTATIEDEVSIIKTLAHELAHQWFGNLVTPKWWDDLWLKEGFSDYLAFLGINHVHPDWSIMDEFLMTEVYRAFEVDVLKSSRPISFDVISTADIRQSFDSISYAKGASVIKMLNHIIGEEHFTKGLIRYLNNHKYDNANRDDLWDAFMNITKEGGVKLEASVKEIMDTWVRQAGLPVVTAVRNYTSGEVHVSQRRFLLTKQNQDKTLWWVPISYTSDIVSQYNTTPKAWLKNVPHSTFQLEANQWWLLNVHQTGYYIVNYDEQNWRMLLEHIILYPIPTRVQLISDSMTLARANLLDYDIPLKMLTNLAIRDKTFSFVPHQVALDRVSYIYNMLITTPIFKKFENFLFRIYEHAFEKYDFDEKLGDSYSEKRMRMLMVKWACKNSASSCTNNAQFLFRNWMQNPSQANIAPNVQEVVFCTAIREGRETEWSIAYKHYLNTKSVYEKTIILNALGCSNEQWILSRYLDALLKEDSEIRKQDAARVFQAVANNPLGHPIAFAYLRTHWKELNEYYGPAFSIISKMVSALPVYMNTPYQLAELEDFKNSNSDNLGTATQAFDRAIEIVKGNIEWVNHSYHSIDQWLDDHKHKYGLRK